MDNAKRLTLETLVAKAEQRKQDRYESAKWRCPPWGVPCSWRRSP